MLILIPNKFFIPIKYIDKEQLHLYGKKGPLVYGKKGYPYKKSKKSKKYKKRDSIIDYFRDMEEVYNDEDKYDFDYDFEIYEEIDDEYVDDKYELEDIPNNNEYEDLFLELDSENIEEV